MHLKRLELSGFKSFANPTVLQFPSRITAIVGPNGSGKSNCAEAMRWVMGEQSMKSLRGKRSEDLIFAGSQTNPRMSKAQVALVFDNNQKQFPVGFDEIAIGRRVFRDGENHYLLNGSPTRLKDTMELLAGVGIGSTQHNIISQGEADRILYVNPSERKEMIEEALGLKVYHLKQEEASRKLAKTEENIKQVLALKKEIQPHIKYLKSQAEKFELANLIRQELEEKYKTFVQKEFVYLASEEESIKNRMAGPEQEIKFLEKKQAELKSDLEKESVKKSGIAITELEDAKKELALARDKRVKLEREMGKIEGLIEAEKSRGVSDDEEAVSKEEVEQFLGEIEDTLSAVLEETTIDEIYAYVNEAIGRITAFVSGLGRESSVPARDSKQIDELNHARDRMSRALAEVYEDEQKLFRKEKELGADAYESERRLRELERALYDCEVQVNKVKDVLRGADLDKERLLLRKEEFVRGKDEASRYIGVSNLGDVAELFEPGERGRLLKEIDRLKFRLEESGGVDPNILREYKDIEDRNAFFEREVFDLEKTADDLQKLASELLRKLDEDFEAGIAKINKEFAAFFSAMFSGGRAQIEIIKPKKHLSKLGGDEDELESDVYHHEVKDEAGIDVKVDLPKKKIKSLEMLSGGERALTSIALLFALSSVNPPPFMVLDEIDAALDEANSRRYGEMLKNLAKETQLIIITHNRESMKQAGVLYGVTMGGDGISKLLSLKLEEAAEYTNR